VDTRSVYFFTVSDNEKSGSSPGPPSDDVLARLNDGDVIRFEPREFPSRRGTKPLTVQFEIEVATGKRGEMVALAQTAAIRDLLDWMATRTQSERGHPNGGDHRH
jgi:hypothetical protein